MIGILQFTIKISVPCLGNTATLFLAKYFIPKSLKDDARRFVFKAVFYFEKKDMSSFELRLSVVRGAVQESSSNLSHARNESVCVGYLSGDKNYPRGTTR